MSSSSDTVSQLRRAIKEKNYKWEAGETTVSRLPRHVAAKKLGLALKKEPPAGTSQTFATTLASCPPSKDWRSVNGTNWVTPIRDQEQCGSCVAFGVTALVEAQAGITSGTPNSWGDLSEASLFFCGGGSCANGWDIPPALDFLKGTGITDENCFPYPMPAVDKPCSDRCADWQQRLKKISGWTYFRRHRDARDWLCEKGPVVAGMDVYDDFFYYTSGVYQHVSGQYVGGHAVCVIGYDEVGKFWICKNSWGTGWGEAGFFKIGYNECNILRRHPVYGVTI